MLNWVFQTGQVKAAAVDVLKSEPFDLGTSPLRDAPNLVVTPHAAWYSDQSQKVFTFWNFLNTVFKLSDSKLTCKKLKASPRNGGNRNAPRSTRITHKCRAHRQLYQSGEFFSRVRNDQTTGVFSLYTNIKARLHTPQNGYRMQMMQPAAIRAPIMSMTNLTHLSGVSLSSRLNHNSLAWHFFLSKSGFWIHFNCSMSLHPQFRRRCKSKRRNKRTRLGTMIAKRRKSSLYHERVLTCI